MHTCDKEHTTFHFNSDFGGDIIIYDKINKVEIKIPAWELLEMVAYNYVMPKRVAELEQMSYKDLLK